MYNWFRDEGGNDIIRSMIFDQELGSIAGEEAWSDEEALRRAIYGVSGNVEIKDGQFTLDGDTYSATDVNPDTIGYVNQLYREAGYGDILPNVSQETFYKAAQEMQGFREGDTKEVDGQLFVYRNGKPQLAINTTQLADSKKVEGMTYNKGSYKEQGDAWGSYKYKTANVGGKDYYL